MGNTKIRKTPGLIEIIAPIFSVLVVFLGIMFLAAIICNTLLYIQTDFIEQSSLQLSTVFGDIQMSGAMLAVFFMFCMANAVLTSYQIFQIVRAKKKEKEDTK